MSSPDKDKIGRLFAQLTGQLEDAGQLAVAGQNRKLSLEARFILVLRLRRRLARTDKTVDMIAIVVAAAKTEGDQ